MNSDSLNMVSRLGEGHMPCTFFLSEPQLKTTVTRVAVSVLYNVNETIVYFPKWTYLYYIYLAFSLPSTWFHLFVIILSEYWLETFNLWPSAMPLTRYFLCFRISYRQPQIDVRMCGLIPNDTSRFYIFFFVCF